MKTIKVCMDIADTAKIMNQANVLHKAGFIEAEKLYDYAQNVIFFDQTNREGHAAKVYFNRLFGKNFQENMSVILMRHWITVMLFVVCI